MSEVNVRSVAGAGAMSAESYPIIRPTSPGRIDCGPRSTSSGS